MTHTQDRVSFPNNKACVCNPELTGNAGVVYHIRFGLAMAIKMNSENNRYFLYRWNGKKWEQI